jgi:hypothetical protein
MIEGIRSFIDKLRLSSARRGPWTISLHESGFRAQPPDKTSDAVVFNWQEINAVVAFKRDCVTVDLICLLVADNTKQLEINEEDIGWHAFAGAIENNLPGSVAYDSWWPAVAHPAFATNSTIIYSKE